jgi:3-deoxy-manno-octulosonate cytidylyltransferase (CMP-KDO synthetase)
VDILGMPMVIHVLKRAQLCKNLSEVFVATDSPEVFDCVLSYGGKAIMTSTEHQTGTDRIAEASDRLACDVVINIQGDEPLVKPEDIDKLVEAMMVDSGIYFATLVCKTPQFNETTECKVVMDCNKDIMYMSRSDIPSNVKSRVQFLHKLYCVVAFRKEWLKKFSLWPQTELEKIEYIEYLRILENGYNIRGVVVDDYSTSVDTQEDLKIVLDMMEKDTTKFRYLK